MDLTKILILNIEKENVGEKLDIINKIVPVLWAY